jgi:DNA integrity scanning protein DisA with diadenylate cyclase activity
VVRLRPAGGLGARPRRPEHGDGGAIFDARGTLRQLGVRLVPSAEAADQVEGVGGTRHTSGRRYSFDDPRATVIVVSEDGPVTVWRAGHLVGTSPEVIEG